MDEQLNELVNLGIVDPAANNNGNGNHEVMDASYNPNAVAGEVQVKPAASLDGASLENAMRQAEGFTALKSYVEPGDDLLSLLMRSDISMHDKDANRWLVAWLVSYDKACEAGQGEQVRAEFMMTLAGRVSFNSRRMKLMTDAVIGLHRSNFDEQSFMSKVKSGLSGIWGNNNSKDESK